jgi:hypothetical protein
LIIGTFDEDTHRPYIHCDVYLPRLNAWGEISFLLDTGADRSLITSGDAHKLMIPYVELIGNSEMAGIGGTIHCFSERAILGFRDRTKRLFVYDIMIDITDDGPYTDEIPSLLGRDVIDRWCIVYDPQKGILNATVRSSDIYEP